MATPLYYFEVAAAPNQFFNKDIDNVPSNLAETPETPLQDKLEALYIDRVEKYKQDYQQLYTQQRWGNIQRNNIYTRLNVKIGGVTEVIVFDGELDARLFEIYLLYGWQGILAIETAMAAARNRPATKFTDPWNVVVPFFNFTRNRLIVLVRESLIEIELLAAQSIYSRLYKSAEIINAGWETQFLFKRKEEIVNTREGALFADTPVMGIKATHAMGNKTLSDTLYPLVTAAVDKKNALNEQIKRKQHLDDVLEFTRNEIGSPPVSIAEAPGEAQRLIDQYKWELDVAMKNIGALASLALPALALLKQSCSQPDMENTIGQALYDLYSSIDILAAAIDPQVSKLFNAIPGVTVNQQLSFTDMERLYGTGYDLEATWVSTAMDMAVKEPAHLVMLNLETLQQLLADTSIAKGSMNHIVCMRYTAVLIEKIEAKRAEEQNWQEVFAVLGKLSAGLSLLAVAAANNPTTVKEASILQGVSIILGIPILLFQIYSLANQLAKFDQILKQQLLASDAYDIDFLNGLGELSAMRSEFTEELTETLLKELLLVFLAGKWGVFKTAMHLRVYYADLEILIE